MNADVLIANRGLFSVQGRLYGLFGVFDTVGNVVPDRYVTICMNPDNVILICPLVRHYVTLQASITIPVIYTVRKWDGPDWQWLAMTQVDATYRGFVFWGTWWKLCNDKTLTEFATIPSLFRDTPSCIPERFDMNNVKHPLFVEEVVPVFREMDHLSAHLTANPLTQPELKVHSHDPQVRDLRTIAPNLWDYLILAWKNGYMPPPQTATRGRRMTTSGLYMIAFNRLLALEFMHRVHVRLGLPVSLLERFTDRELDELDKTGGVPTFEAKAFGKYISGLDFFPTVLALLKKPKAVEDDGLRTLIARIPFLPCLVLIWFVGMESKNLCERGICGSPRLRFPARFIQRTLPIVPLCEWQGAAWRHVTEIGGSYVTYDMDEDAVYHDVAIPENIQMQDGLIAYWKLLGEHSAIRVLGPLDQFLGESPDEILHHWLAGNHGQSCVIIPHALRRVPIVSSEARKQGWLTDIQFCAAFVRKPTDRMSLPAAAQELSLRMTRVLFLEAHYYTTEKFSDLICRVVQLRSWNKTPSASCTTEVWTRMGVLTPAPPQSMASHPRIYPAIRSLACCKSLAEFEEYMVWPTNLEEEIHYLMAGGLLGTEADLGRRTGWNRLWPEMRYSNARPPSVKGRDVVQRNRISSMLHWERAAFFYLTKDDLTMLTRDEVLTLLHVLRFRQVYYPKDMRLYVAIVLNPVRPQSTLGDLMESPELLPTPLDLIMRHVLYRNRTTDRPVPPAIHTLYWPAWKTGSVRAVRLVPRQPPLLVPEAPSLFLDSLTSNVAEDDAWIDQYLA